MTDLQPLPMTRGRWLTLVGGLLLLFVGYLALALLIASEAPQQ